MRLTQREGRPLLLPLSINWRVITPSSWNKSLASFPGTCPVGVGCFVFFSFIFPPSARPPSCPCGARGWGWHISAIYRANHVKKSTQINTGVEYKEPVMAEMENWTWRRPHGISGQILRSLPLLLQQQQQQQQQQIAASLCFTSTPPFSPLFPFPRFLIGWWRWEEPGVATGSGPNSATSDRRITTGQSVAIQPAEFNLLANLFLDSCENFS